ncbi:hypothetical protein Tco_1330064 [Tanacetum coccineum]
MIGSLMYLTASRPDLVFAVCMCARYQSKPTKKHLEAVKRVFQYLQGSINMGLWYPKDTAMALTSYTDTDHAGCQDTQRSTSGNIMADANAPVKQAPAVAPPTRTDEQILPRIRWVPIGKSNCYLDAEKSQSNPIYKIAVDILKQTNFFRAFTASSTIPAIYIQQFWDTICYDKPNGGYKCHLDEQWFNLNKDTLRDALQITPHKFHPRPESPFHLPTEEPILGYLKFSAKGTKREVFGMPIPNELITDDIRDQLHDAYHEKRAPTKPKEKKQKQAKETTEATPPAKRAKVRKVVKKRTLNKSQQLVDEFVDEGIPLTEPGFGDLEADTQRAIEESLKDAHGAPRGPLPPVVFRETDTGKFQPLPEVEGKGKEKVSAEQAAQATDESSQSQPEQMDEGFTATVYPNVLENLKLTVDKPVILEEPASSTRTLSSLEHLAKDFSFGDQFFNDKPSKADNEKTTTNTEAESSDVPSQSIKTSLLSLL